MERPEAAAEEDRRAVARAELSVVARAERSAAALADRSAAAPADRSAAAAGHHPFGSVRIGDFDGDDLRRVAGKVEPGDRRGRGLEGDDPAASAYRCLDVVAVRRGGELKDWRRSFVAEKLNHGF